jgi:hypothetical protein
MARRAPEVARGARGTFIVPEAGPQTTSSSAPRELTAPTPAKKEGFRRFKSRYDGYRLTVTMPQSYIDPHTGRRVTDAGKAARFNEGYFETNDVETIAVCDRACTRYPQDIWDLDVAEQKQQESAVDSLVSIVSGAKDPAVKAKLLEALGAKVAEEFELPQSE